jgi:GNAT superfamily N-acetyltransferase
VAARDTPGRIRRNTPDPIPAALLGRLAVDRRLQGAGLGRALVRDAALRVAAAADLIAVRCLIVHAASQPAAQLWEHLGFDPSPNNPLLLAIRLADLPAARP